MVENLGARFPEETLNVLDSFSIFDVERLPGSDSFDFQHYCNREIAILAEHFYPGNSDLHDGVTEEFESFKFELAELKVKWDFFKSSMSANNLPIKFTATEWALRNIARNFDKENTEYPNLINFAKIALVTPVSNAWPERGASAVKRIKTRLRSTMSNDVLRSLLFISLNGPSVVSPEADRLVKNVAATFMSAKKRYKKIQQHTKSLGVQTADVDVQTTDLESDGDTDSDVVSTEYLVTNLAVDSSSDESSDGECF